MKANSLVQDNLKKHVSVVKPSGCFYFYRKLSQITVGLAEQTQVIRMLYIFHYK